MPIINPALDASGNGNNWTPININYFTSGVTYDTMTDVPTNTNATTANFCVINPLSGISTNAEISQGNLRLRAIDNDASRTMSFQVPTSGKYYLEWFCEQISVSTTSMTGVLGAQYRASGEVYSGATLVTTVASYDDGDLLSAAVDADNSSVAFYKNNTLQTTVTGLSGTDRSIFCYMARGSNNFPPGDSFIYNFGQRPFTYTPPTGFVALNTFNLPTPTIGATASTQANSYMDATLYTGNGSTQSIVNAAGFAPGLVWVKQRNGTGWNIWTDIVRGANKQLYSNSTLAEGSDTALITALNSNGFSLGYNGGSDVNASGGSYVGWQWNAGGTTVTNTSGSISAQVRANTTSGFSVVTYTGTGANATVGHGLGVAPRFIIFKNRITSPRNWIAYHASLGATVFLEPNTTAAQNSDSTQFNNTVPTSTVFSVGSSTNTNQNTNGQVAYCFSQVAGYSAFGSYTGNGSADGPFVYLGFEPKYVLVKASSTTGGWNVVDGTRSPSNIVDDVLFPNLSDAEGTFNWMDFTSNGFKIRNTLAGSNSSGVTYIYAAFAETPFNYANAR